MKLTQENSTPSLILQDGLLLIFQKVSWYLFVFSFFFRGDSMFFCRKTEQHVSPGRDLCARMTSSDQYQMALTITYQIETR